MSVASGLGEFLLTRTSRRGFLAKATVTATALTVAPVDLLVRPGTAYAAICECAPGTDCGCSDLCCDGYTQFCCTINDGYNVCPRGTFAGGWWKADGSIYCSGPRYYIDCMGECQGCGCGGGNFCPSCDNLECECALGDCNNRHVGCTEFRYGQCHQEISCSGRIACRVVSCRPPWDLDPTCTTTSQTDDSTANHFASCQNGPTSYLPETIGIYRPSTNTFELRNSNTTGPEQIVVKYGTTGDIPVVGDWNGDGTTTIGIYRPSTNTFELRNSNTTGPEQIVVKYGTTGDIPVVGDWNGDGTTTIGIYRPSTNTFELRNSNTTGPEQIVAKYGTTGDIPVVGDWNGDGTTTIGIYRPSTNTFELRNSNTTGPEQIVAKYGTTGDIPVVGDWNGDGTTTIGIYRPSTNTFELRNSNTTGPEQIVAKYGTTGDIPVVGQWETI